MASRRAGEYGGAGLDLLGLVVVWEEMARTIAMPPRGPSVFGPDLRPILFTLNDRQKEKYLHPVLRGEKITAFAQSEPDAGSDPGAMRTTAVRQGDHYSSTAPSASSPTPTRARFFAELIAATDRAKGSAWRHLGLDLRRASSARREAGAGAGARHPRRSPVGDHLRQREGAGRGPHRRGGRRLPARAALDQCRPASVTARAQHGRDRSAASSSAARYAKQRVTFGAPLADRQAVQWMLVDSFIELHQKLRPRSTTWRRSGPPPTSSRT